VNTAGSRKRVIAIIIRLICKLVLPRLLAAGQSNKRAANARWGTFCFTFPLVFRQQSCFRAIDKWKDTRDRKVSWQMKWKSERRETETRKHKIWFDGVGKMYLPNGCSLSSFQIAGVNGPGVKAAGKSEVPNYLSVWNA